MKGGIRLIAILLAVLFFGLAFSAYYLYFYNQDADRVVLPEKNAHFYDDPQISIKNIRVKVFYAVPANRGDAVNENWREVVAGAFEKIAAFHKLQFRGLSEISFDIFPAPVFLEQNEVFYNTASTDFGNPRGLIAVAEEIESRVMVEGGDLYNEQFVETATNDYPIMGLIYEGVGASGGVIYETNLGTKGEIAESLGLSESMVYVTDVKSAEGFFILNIDFLADKDLSVFGPTFLYHELAHSFGLPDRGELSGIVVDNDIMGYGRREPLDTMYIGKDLLLGVGIF